MSKDMKKKEGTSMKKSVKGKIRKDKENDADDQDLRWSNEYKGLRKVQGDSRAQNNDDISNTQTEMS